jgi:hypothetical protein
MGYDFQKSHVTGPWDHKVSVSAKKVSKKCHACVPFRNQVSHLYYEQVLYKGVRGRDSLSVGSHRTQEASPPVQEAKENNMRRRKFQSVVNSKALFIFHQKRSAAYFVQ